MRGDSEALEMEDYATVAAVAAVGVAVAAVVVAVVVVVSDETVGTDVDAFVVKVDPSFAFLHPFLVI
jgi:hypothetical protein